MNSEKVRTYLDSGLEKIDEKTLEDLKTARNNALSRYSAHALAIEGHGLFHFHHPRIGIWLPTAALILGLCAILYWGAMKNENQPLPLDANDDAALLSDDLPVPAYTDQKFFDSWLKHSNR